MNEPLSFCFNFYNNWHIARVGFFTSQRVTHFLDAVIATNAIVTHRWGDSTIQAYSVRLFSHPDKLFQVQNFTYIHGSHGLVVVSNGHENIDSTVPNSLAEWKHKVSTKSQQGQQQQHVQDQQGQQHDQGQQHEQGKQHEQSQQEQEDVEQEKKDEAENWIFLLACFLTMFCFFLNCLRND
jgi:hypothetical protein